jgi:hypothetical protein
MIKNKNKNKNKNKIFFDINADKYMSSMVSDEFAKDHRKITFVCYLLLILTNKLK